MKFIIKPPTFSRGLFVGALLILATRVDIQAQDTTRKHSNNCYRGRPAPTCDAFLLTEFGYFRRVVRPTTVFTFPAANGAVEYAYAAQSSSYELQWEVGGMVNRGARSAIGGTLVLGYGGDGGSTGIKARYRRWLSHEALAADFGAGLMLSSPANGYRQNKTVEFVGDAALNAGDYVSLVGRFETVRANGKVKPLISVGVRAGSKPALVATAVTTVAFGVIIAAFSNWGD